MYFVTRNPHARLMASFRVLLLLCAKWSRKVARRLVSMATT